MYRNDHDAALWRIDALEAEVRRLEGELARRDATVEPTIEPDSSVAMSWAGGIAIALAVMLLGIVFSAAMVARPQHHHPSRSTVIHMSTGRSTCTEMTTMPPLPGSMLSKTSSKKPAQSAIAW